MSDAMDAVAEAVFRTRRLAATHLVRKQELEAEVARLQRDRAADPGTDARLAVANTELLAATQDYQDALAEITKLQQLGQQSRQADVRTVVSGTDDPLIRSFEQIALDNVRDRVADLDAQERLSDELGERPRIAPAPRSREEADAAARREFEALRARRLDPGAEPDPPSARTKKTL